MRATFKSPEPVLGFLQSPPRTLRVLPRLRTARPRPPMLPLKRPVKTALNPRLTKFPLLLVSKSWVTAAAKAVTTMMSEKNAPTQNFIPPFGEPQGAALFNRRLSQRRFRFVSIPANGGKLDGVG